MKTKNKMTVSSEMISKRAFEIYLGRGATEGSADMDWLQAEAELCAETMMLVKQKMSDAPVESLKKSIVSSADAKMATAKSTSAKTETAMSSSKGKSKSSATKRDQSKSI
jgi:hypothetical protein